MIRSLKNLWTWLTGPEIPREPPPRGYPLVQFEETSEPEASPAEPEVALVESAIDRRDVREKIVPPRKRRTRRHK